MFILVEQVDWEYNVQVTIFLISIFGVAWYGFFEVFKNLFKTILASVWFGKATILF